MTLKRTPLYEVHKKLGAKFTEFGGFEMPIQFSSIKEEHLTVRKKVGLFDVSHMGNIWVTGEDAEKLLSLTTMEDASKIIPGKSQYTAILREDGTIIDDTIFMNTGKKYMLIPNVGKSEKIAEWINKKAKENNLNAKAENVSDEFVILAVQGPKSKETLQKLTDENLNEISFFGNKYININNLTCLISYTGYTGEIGFEFQINPVDKAKELYFKILEAGEEFGIKPIGLGARDTLRLEKFFLLAGNEFNGTKRTPLEAGISWFINWDHEFIGKKALLKQKKEGNYETLTALICTERGIPRKGCKVQKQGKKVGEVTSGTLSPCLNKGIAMAYIKPGFREIGNKLDIIIRNKPVEAEIVKPPIVKKDWDKNQTKKIN